MFQTEEHNVSITNLNVRIERHGDERALAIDLSLDLFANNSILDTLDPQLRVALFRKPGAGDQQDLLPSSEELTAVRMAGVKNIGLPHEFSGYELQLSGELEGTEPFFLADVKLKKFVASPKEGGSVGLSFKASANVDPDDVAELTEALIRGSGKLTLTPPQSQPSPQQDLDV